MGYTRNHAAIDAQLARCGFFLIGETDFTKTTAEVPELYSRRDVVEKSFDELKNELDMKRLRCHNGDTTEGKMFVAFPALIVKSYMMGKLRTFMQQNSYPFRKIQLELDNTACFSVSPKAKPCLTNPLTKLQRAIYTQLELETDMCLPYTDNAVCDNSVGI